MFGYTCLCTLLARLQAQSRRARLHAAGGRYLRINQDARGAASGPMCDIRSKFLQTPVSSTQLQVLRLADKNTRRNAEKMPWLIMVLVLSATVRLSAQNTDQQSDQPPPQGEIRTYYIAADEIDWDYARSRIDWDYARSRIDQITGQKIPLLVRAVPTLARTGKVSASPFHLHLLKERAIGSLSDGDSTPISVLVKSACVNRSHQFLDPGPLGSCATENRWARSLHGNLVRLMAVNGPASVNLR